MIASIDMVLSPASKCGDPRNHTVVMDGHGRASQRLCDGVPRGQIDSRLQEENELEFDPAVDATKIGVTATDGVVMLTGNVRSYAEKWDSEKIAKRVYGVKGVANDLEVVLEGDAYRDDGDIARSALNALNWNFSIPKDKTKVSVSKGWLTLDGGGVAISERPSEVAGSGCETEDQAALKRNAEVDSEKIKVQAVDSTVTLTGSVRTWVERDDAVNAAWSAPGVTKVVDRISLEA